jgi:hypothetical protein
MGSVESITVLRRSARMALHDSTCRSSFVRLRARGRLCLCVRGESAVRGFWEDESIRVAIIGAQRAQGTPWQMSALARTFTGSLESAWTCFYAAKRLYLRYNSSLPPRVRSLWLQRRGCCAWDGNTITHVWVYEVSVCSMHFSPCWWHPGPRLWRDSINDGDFYDLRLVLSGLGAVPDK